MHAQVNLENMNQLNEMERLESRNVGRFYSHLHMHLASLFLSRYL